MLTQPMSSAHITLLIVMHNLISCTGVTIKQQHRSTFYNALHHTTWTPQDMPNSIGLSEALPKISQLFCYILFFYGR